MTSAVGTDTAPSALQPVTVLLGTLNARGVRYCHWKGTFRLDAAMAGLGDLDLLVDPDHVGGFEDACRDAGFRPTRPVRRDARTDRHWFALDPGRTAVAHVHVQHDLPLAQGDAWGYVLPWHETVLEARVFDEDRQVWVVDPTVELALFAVRMALTVGATGRLAPKRAEEFRWLASRVSAEEVRAAAVPLVGPAAATLMARLATSPPTAGALRDLRRQMRPRPGRMATRNAAGAGARWTQERVERFRRAVGRRTGRHGTRPRRRTPAGGGRLVAVLGVDGSGKSTVMEETARWLAPVVDVMPAYLGGGKRTTSPLRHLLRLVHRTCKRIRQPKPGPHAHPGQRIVTEEGGGLVRHLRQLWFVLWALTLASARAKSVARAWQSVDRGMLVVADRFPQMQVAGLHDGPLLAPWREHRSRALRAAARREERLHRQTTARPPDLVIVLSASLAVVSARRQTSDPALLRRKAEIVDTLVFPPETRVERLDADRPLDEVLADVRRVVWDAVLEPT
jgi:hypothetical protein